MRVRVGVGMKEKRGINLLCMNMKMTEEISILMTVTVDGSNW